MVYNCLLWFLRVQKQMKDVMKLHNPCMGVQGEDRTSTDGVTAPFWLRVGERLHGEFTCCDEKFHDLGK
jgi:hypothetical protein